MSFNNRLPISHSKGVSTLSISPAVTEVVYPCDLVSRPYRAGLALAGLPSVLQRKTVNRQLLAWLSCLCDKTAAVAANYSQSQPICIIKSFQLIVTVK